MIYLDFETAAIQDRPAYPPKPVGLAFLRPSRQEQGYLAWGHPSENNCTYEYALRFLLNVWASGEPVCFHNAKFDLAISYEAMGLPELDWRTVHDTMFLAYLNDPHARSLGLKDLAAEVLNWPPDERDEVAEWIWTNRRALVAQYGGRITRAKHGESSVGAWISRAPGNLVGRYAIGDVQRTRALFERLFPLIERFDMGAAYDRERRLLPILMDNERLGVRVDVPALERDIALYRRHQDHVETWMRKELRASGLNFDADRDVAAVFAERGVVPDDAWTYTKTGQRSVAKGALTPDKFADPRIASALGYRNRLVTSLSMFMEPWLAQAVKRGGYVSTTWNQVRGAEGGTRTGRPSTSRPNFLNLAKNFEAKKDGYEHPAFLGVDPLPLVRRYMLPDEGDVWIGIDFAGQELRVFAHFEQGALMRAYLEDPDLDPHSWVGAEMTRLMNTEFERTKVKILNFLALYGGGIPAATKQLQCTTVEARRFKEFHEHALPGRKELSQAIQSIVRMGDPIRTWGGRLYFPETPRVVDGQMRSFEYKLLNYLVQGSAADLTKQAINDWYDADGRNARFLVQVYDEICISAPEAVAHEQLGLLKSVMERPRLDVPMRTDPEIGASWGSLNAYP